MRNRAAEAFVSQSELSFFFRVLAARLRSPALSMPATISCCRPGSPSLARRYHVCLGGGKEFQDVELCEPETLDIELKNHEVLTFGIGGCPLRRTLVVVRVAEEAFNGLKTGGLHLKPPKFEHIFAAVITFPPFFCANTFDTSLLLSVCALS